MVDVEALKQEELESIENNSNDEVNVEDEVYDLERLIVGGAKVRIPIIIKYPLEDGGTTDLAVKLKPLTDVEVDNAVRAYRKNKNTSIRIEYLKRGLYTKDDKPFPSHLLKDMYTGVTASLYEKLCEISGVPTNEDDKRVLMDELMGF